MSRMSAIKFTMPLRVSTDEASSMIGRTAGTVALLEEFLDRPLLKYHCIIYTKSLCMKNVEIAACYDISCKICEQNYGKRMKQEAIQRLWWAARYAVW